MAERFGIRRLKSNILPVRYYEWFKIYTSQITIYCLSSYPSLSDCFNHTLWTCNSIADGENTIKICGCVSRIVVYCAPSGLLNPFQVIAIGQNHFLSNCGYDHICFDSKLGTGNFNWSAATRFIRGTKFHPDALHRRNFTVFSAQAFRSCKIKNLNTFPLGSFNLIGYSRHLCS